MTAGTATIVQGEGGSFCEDAGASWTLPSRYYTDPAILAAEEARIFRRAWSYVGHVSELAEAGSYVTDRVAGQPVLVLRDRDGGLRAFFNVCRHRAHLLLRGCGRLQAGITCPYHAWTYALDGRLKAARLTDDVAGFDKADFPLRPLPVTEVAGLVFVALDAAVAPFEAGTEGFAETLLGHLPGLPAFTLRARLEFDIRANWKVCVDNFSEAYHIPIAHPELSKLHGGQPKAARQGARFAFYRNTARSSYQGFAVQPGESYVSWTLWPHHCMLSLPGSAHLVMLRMTPLAADRCLERVDVLAPPGEMPPNLEHVVRLFAEGFNREDIALVESVQQGLASAGYDQGRYVVDRADSWFSESALHGFHRQILAALA